MQAHQLNPVDNLNIPESGDGVPDILNEAQWEIDWLMKMQKDDGGVFNKLASELWEFGAPATSDLAGHVARYFMSRTTHDTATTGAVFAMASRLWSPYNTQLSEVLMERALRAYQFLQQYPTATPAEGFVNPPGLIFISVN